MAINRTRILTTLLLAWLIAGAASWLANNGLFPTIAPFAKNLIWVSIIALSAYLAGSPVAKKISGGQDKIENALVAVGVGFGIFIAILFLLGITVLLYRSAILVIVAAPILASTGRIRRFAEQPSFPAMPKLADLGSVELLAFATAFVALCVAALGLFAPETFYDALYYHDAFPSLYLIRHKMEIFPNAAHSVMPSNIDLLYTMPLSFGDAGAVKILHFGFYLGTIAWIYSLASRFGGRTAGAAAVACFATIPGPAMMAGIGAVDLGVTFFSLGAASLLFKWMFDESDSRLPVASAIFLGLAVGSKYSALMVGAVCAVWIIAGAIRNRSKLGVGGAIKAVAVYGAISLAVASPWYARAWMATGDPLYPALSQSGSDGAWARANLEKDSDAAPSLSGVFTSLPKSMWKQQGQFGAGSPIGVVALAFLPALLWGFARAGFARFAAAGIVMLFVMWSRSILITRYLYPAFGLAAALAGCFIAALDRSKLNRAVIGVFFAFAAVASTRSVAQYYEHPGIGVFRYLTMNKKPIEHIEAYTASGKAANFVSANLPANAKLLLVGETASYYYLRDCMPVSGYDRHPLGDWLKSSPTPEALWKAVTSKGFTHMVVNENEWKRLGKAYGYLQLGESETAVFNAFTGGLKKIYSDKSTTIYELFAQ